MRDRSAGRNQFTAVGRRKTAIAKVLLQPGAGNIIVDGKPLEERFPRPLHQFHITLPLRLTNMIGSYNVLVKADESLKPALRAAGLLTRDSRMKERKKPGLKRARKAPQYTKR